MTAAGQATGTPTVPTMWRQLAGLTIHLVAVQHTQAGES